MVENARNKKGLWAVIVRELHRLVSRPIYLLSMVAFPLFTGFLLLSLMKSGLPTKIPVAIVDQDRSDVSRTFIQKLGSLDMVDICYKVETFTEARELMQAGEIFGFLMIPESFEAKAMAARQPQISFYTNNAYFIPSSLLYKSFKTMSVLASAAVVEQLLLAMGEDHMQIMTALQPIALDMHPLGNPTLNYSVYLNNSFIPGVLELMILLVTVYSIGVEIKEQKSREWLETANGSIVWAITGKLLPQTIIFVALGWLAQSVFYGYLSFPMNGKLWHMMLAMFLLVLASQSLAVIIMCFAPSLRIGLSAAGLFGILGMSLSGFSFPLPAMYELFHLPANLVPLRHYFLIYVDQALNGIPLYYSRWHYIALICFAIASTALLPRLKNALMRQVYVP